LPARLLYRFDPGLHIFEPAPLAQRRGVIVPLIAETAARTAILLTGSALPPKQGCCATLVQSCVRQLQVKRLFKHCGVLYVQQGRSGRVGNPLGGQL